MDANVLRDLATDPAAFRAALRIDADAGPRLFGESLDDWQRRDFEILDPACRAIVGQDVEAKYRRAWIERPRGHSKTSDIAAVASGCCLLRLASCPALLPRRTRTKPRSFVLQFSVTRDSILGCRSS